MKDRIIQTVMSMLASTGRGLSRFTCTLVETGPPGNVSGGGDGDSNSGEGEEGRRGNSRHSKVVVRSIDGAPVLDLHFCFISCKHDLNIDGLISEVSRLALHSLSRGSADSLTGDTDGVSSDDTSARDVYSVALTQREDSYVTRERHRQHLVRCSERLDRILTGDAFKCTPLDVLAEELRLALRDLGAILGRVDVEELLDVIFRDFCIGK